MILRALSFAGGVAGAVALSQFPEFSQQYLQRLAGAVDELRAIVVSFDATAARANMTREQALADLTGSEFRDGLRRDKTAQIARYERLAADYQALRHSEPIDRLWQVFRFSDADLARRTWSDFRPAVPATPDGLLFAGVGFVGGWVLLAILAAALLRPFRRRRDPPEPQYVPEPSHQQRFFSSAPPERERPLALHNPLPQGEARTLSLRDRADGSVRQSGPPRLPGAARPDGPGSR